jgi:hypothetical protein
MHLPRTVYWVTLMKTVLLFLLALWATSALSQDAIGVIKRAHGQAVIERSGTKLPAVRGTQVRKGDRIVTGARGNVDITMRGGALSVGPHANVAVDRFAPEETQSARSPMPSMLKGLVSWLSVNRSR